ncbi:MAG: hypothetical protein ACYS22_05180 [Planctomycetota bacterium]
MTHIGPRSTQPTSPIHGVDAQPDASPSVEATATGEASASGRASGGPGRMAVMSSLSAMQPEERAELKGVKKIVSQVLAGERKLNVATAQKLMRKTVRDKSVDLREELAPLKELFEGELAMGPDAQILGDLKDGVEFTEAGRLIMQSFVFNAGELHAEIGESRSPEVRQLRDTAADATAPMASRERLRELLDQYKDTRVSPHASGKYIPFTHEHESNHDIEVFFVGLSERLDSYVNSAFNRFFTSDAKADRLENDPLKNVREYLEGNYERIQ